MNRHAFSPGTDTGYASDSPSNDFSAIFEDDGQTGYFYAYRRGLPQGGILDAVHIYDAASVVDRHLESTAEIPWSSDGLKAALLINAWPHAVIDFGARCSYCRTGFPPPPGSWRRGSWTDDVMQSFEPSSDTASPIFASGNQLDGCCGNSSSSKRLE